MLSRLLLRTAMVHVPHRRREEQATYQLSDHTLTLKNADVEHQSSCLLQSPSMIFMLTGSVVKTSQRDSLHTSGIGHQSQQQDATT